MSSDGLFMLVAICAAVFSLAAFIGLIVVPAMQAYSKVWERVAAGFLTLYVLVALVGVGAVAGVGVVLLWGGL